MIPSTQSDFGRSFGRVEIQRPVQSVECGLYTLGAHEPQKCRGLRNSTFHLSLPAGGKKKIYGLMFEIMGETGRGWEDS